MNKAGKVLLDTSVIIDYIRGDQSLRAQFAAVATIYVPLVALGELHFGAQRAQRPNEALAQVREFLRIATLLLPDENTAGEYGLVKAELARIGRLIPENDVWIAAAARQHDLPIATRDAHFAVVPRLIILDW
jgi:tRNA(fMet)-specific endonuclease VapC